MSNHDEIILKAKEIQQHLFETEIYKMYKQTYDQVKLNEEINVIIHTITNLQKEIVTLKHLEKKEAVKVKDSELSLLKEELLSIPLYQAYIEYQNELDALIQIITKQIHEAINTP